MTEAQARRLVAGDYVATLNHRMPVGYKVTRVDASGARTLIQIAQLYGEDLVLATAFHRVDGPTLTKTEIAAVAAECARQQAVIATHNPRGDE